MRTNLTHTIPSLSGTFGIPTRLALNPKMPKEPSSPSLSNARIERQCIHNETTLPQTCLFQPKSIPVVQPKSILPLLIYALTLCVNSSLVFTNQFIISYLQNRAIMS